MRIIKLNTGLVKYLLRELPKKKNFVEIIKFLKSTLIFYIKELIKLYTNLFLIMDVNYQKQKKQHQHYKQIQVDLQRCLKMLQYIDTKMEKAGINRQRRRQFWRDFYKDGQIRKEMFDQLANEINQIK
jgi:hypothetical protein